MRRHITAFFVFLFAFARQGLFAAPGVICAYEPDRNDGLTSSGEVFSPSSMTCAHKSLPFGTRVAFTNGSRMATNVIVNDRIDADESFFFVTRDVFSRLGDVSKGIMDVNCMVLELGDNSTSWIDKGNSWHVATNVRSSDPFSLYGDLLKMGYRPRMSASGDGLEIPYVVDHRWGRLISDLENLGVDISSVGKADMEMSPMRL